MPKGPPPKPTALKVVAGNPGKRPLNENEPKPPKDESVSPPKRLRGLARTEWKRIAPLLRDSGLLTKVDRNALALYCDSYALYCEALEKVRAEGPVILSPEKNYPIQNPQVAVVNKQGDRMKVLLTEFGMTPSSRSRVQVVPPEGAAAGEWEDFDES